MLRLLFAAFSILALSVAMTFQAAAERRIALVIANGRYQHTSPLANPINDAELISRTLASVGFNVTKILDAKKDEMQFALLQFERVLQTNDTVGLFYYAGHGLQADGVNYLIPIDADIQNENEIPLQTIWLNPLLRALESSTTFAGRVNIVILDACRNNPFSRSWRSVAGGLAAIDAPGGTLIAFSTAPGDVAEDGDDGNSPYAKGLARAILQKGLTIEETFKSTRSYVLQATVKGRRQQTPWEQSSLTGSFYFVPRDGPNQTFVTQSGDPELVFWESVKDSLRAAELEAYLHSFPEGKFTELARLKISQIGKTSITQAAPHESGKVRPLVDPALLPDDLPDYAARHGEIGRDNEFQPNSFIGR